MMRPTGFAVAPLTLASLLASGLALRAQTPLHAQYAEQAGVNYFGQESATGLGDVDGDGVPDYAVGARCDGYTSGYVAVYSGGTGQLLVKLTGNGGRDRFGCSVAGLGDINGDLIPDLLVGASHDNKYGLDKGLVQVISGSDWSVLREQTGRTTSFGSRVGKLGDANGDGVSEYLVSERWDAVSCFDGVGGGLLWKYVGGYWDAVRISHTSGDANGDGIADALIGAPGIPSPNPITPYVLVLDGATGTEIHRLLGSKATSFGSSVSWIGDTTGDGASEFAVGIPWSPVGSHDVGIHDGATGALLYGVTGTVALGSYVCGLGDQNGDGVPDFADSDPGQAMLFSGVDGSVLHAYDTTPMVSNINATTWLAPAGDLDGDGAQELLNSTYSSSGLAAGAVVVFSSSAHALEDLGYALGGARGEPVLAAQGALLDGSVLLADLSNAALRRPAFLVLGVSGIYFPFAGGTLVPSPDLALGLNTNGQGGHEFWVTLPPGIPNGTQLYLQYWIFDSSGPAGWTASNGVRAVFP